MRRSSKAGRIYPMEGGGIAIQSRVGRDGTHAISKKWMQTRGLSSSIKRSITRLMKGISQYGERS
jgi:hypothetical protein